MAETVYVLCAAASLVCAALLFRGYLQTKTRLLLWSSICFTGLAVNNVILVVDLVLRPEADMSLVRNATALIAMMVLVFGLVWEAE
jgi:hypothetical protein